ncbi:MAG: sugar phosphate isomerase/epimerase [Cyclobacteriaceae bacterium]|jgi:sugar phosphate isomerase/epimerase|nr:sugar phosphate isomerase/epimerase [Cyclobacteriaceae bacterium]
MINRRRFITTGIAGLTGASLFASSLVQGKENAKRIKEIGFQSWIVREEIGKDLTGTLRKMGAMGYNSMELCSPQGYSKLGFGPLQDIPPATLKKMIKDAGFTCVSCHYGLGELRDHGQERIDYAKELGLTQMIIASPGLPKDATLDDWKRAADDANKIGELARKSGVVLGYHNHNFEFEKLDGQLIYDVLLDRLDPDLVKLQFQVWVIIAGYKAADYFNRYPGRYISAHLYDWSGKGEEMVPLGKGVVDWKEFFAAAEKNGVKNYFVEMGPPNLEESAKFLKAWKG